MLQRLRKVFAQVKVGNTPENLTKLNQSNYIFFVSRKRN